jgi:hypothetical protein
MLHKLSFYLNIESTIQKNVFKPLMNYATTFNGQGNAAELKRFFYFD